MVLDSLSFLTYKGACGGCQAQVWWMRRHCPSCGKAYPTSRPVFYWLGAVIFALGVVCIPIGILGYFGIL